MQRIPSTSTKAQAAEIGRRSLARTTARTFIDYRFAGGTRSFEEIRAFLMGRNDLPDTEFDKLATSLNWDFTSRGQNHPVPMSDELDD